MLKKFSILILLASCASSNREFNVVHYNIKELSTEKINKENFQMKKVKEVLAEIKYDILSLNEIQYDLKNVPNERFETEGENINKIRDILGLPKTWNTSFVQANTGNKAQRSFKGTYAEPSDPKARELADIDNYGIFPGQYSTGAILKFPIIEKKHISNIVWKKFNPKRDFTSFKDSKGKAINPELELFDKSFTDLTIQVGEDQVHIILLHTVPAYHFGNFQSPNFARNQDQLRFLEWYLTGSTDIEVGDIGISPLKKDSYYVAMGDFNVEITALDNPGSEVLWRLKDKTHFWTNDLSYTYEADGFDAAPLRLMLDYIIVSPLLEVVKGEIVNNYKFSRTELGCDVVPNEKVLTVGKHQEIINYYKRNLSCRSVVDKKDFTLKMASDHFPLFAKIRIPKRN